MDGRELRINDMAALNNWCWRVAAVASLVVVLAFGLALACAQVALAQSAPQVSLEEAVQADGPVAFFPLGEAAGSGTIEDASASHRYTAKNHGVALGGEGPLPYGRSGSFDGEGAYAELPSDPLAEAHEFTFAAWVSFDGGSYKQPVFMLGSSSSNFMYLTPSAYKTASSSKGMLFEIRTSSGASASVEAGKGGKQWEYVAVTETKTGAIAIYQEGEEKGASSGATVWPASLGSTTGNYLGRSMSTSEPSLDGSLSDVAFYTRALSAAQVHQLYDQAERPYATKAPWWTEAAEEGHTLHGREGEWFGLPGSKALQWELCSPACVPIENEEDAKDLYYRITPEDVGSKLRLRVTVTSSAGEGVAYSEESPTVSGTKPKNTLAPAIVGYSGHPHDGEVLEAEHGDWNGSPDIRYEYRWESCLQGSCLLAEGTNDEATYRVPTSDIGRTLQVTVTDVSRAGEESASSAETAFVTEGSPVVLALPSVAGEAREGRTLTAGPGEWFMTLPYSYTFRWLHCEGAKCEAIPGAEGETYLLGAEYLGQKIEVEVSARNEVGSAAALSAPSATVAGNPPVSVERPSIEGPGSEGEALTAQPGRWSGTQPISLQYAWEACAKGECQRAGTGRTFTPQRGGAGSVRLVVTAENSQGEASAASPVWSLAEGAPVSSSRPAIEGSASEGETLSAQAGQWTGAPGVYAYRWLHCSAGGCEEIAGARGETYKLGSEYIGQTIELEVSAENAAGATSALSARTEAVKPKPPANTERPAIQGEAVEGEALTATPGKWTGAPGTFVYRWFSCEAGACEAIAGAPEVASYTPSSENVGKQLEVQVSAQNAAGAGEASAPPTTPVLVHGGAAVTWGPNKWGQLAAGFQNSYESAPVGALPGLDDIVQLRGSLALLNNGTVAAFGGDAKGELGNGEKNRESPWELGRAYTMVQRENPATHEPEGLLEGVVAVAGGGTHRLALLSDGEVVAWGNNEFGQLGQGPGEHGFEGTTKTYINQFLPKTVQQENPETHEPVPLSGIVAIAAGGGASYALSKEGTLFAWGSDGNGQLAIADPEVCDEHDEVHEKCSSVARPVQWRPELSNPEPLRGVKAIRAGRWAAYAVLDDGEVVSWGKSSDGRLGNGGTTNPPGTKRRQRNEEDDAPAYVVTSKSADEEVRLKEVAEVAPGDGVVFARTNSGQLYAWGNDENEDALGGIKPDACNNECVDLATQATTLEGELRERSDGGVIEQLAAGQGAGYALVGGKMFAWGSNSEGRLGIGKPASASYTVTQVSGIGPVQEIGAAGALLRKGSQALPPLLSAVAHQRAIDLYWQKATLDEYEKIEAQLLTYRLRGSPEAGEEEIVTNIGERGPYLGSEPPTIGRGEGREAVNVGREPVVVEEALQAEPGEWTGEEETQLGYSYQWQRCKEDCESGEREHWENIEGADETTYTPTKTELGDFLRVVVKVSETVEGEAGERETRVSEAISQRTGAVETAAAYERGIEKTRLGISEAFEELLPQEVFEYGIHSTRYSPALQPRPYVLIFQTTNERIRRLVATPLE